MLLSMIEDPCIDFCVKDLCPHSTTLSVHANFWQYSKAPPPFKSSNPGLGTELARLAGRLESGSEVLCKRAQYAGLICVLTPCHEKTVIFF